MVPEQLLRVREVATMLRVHKNTIYNWLSSGKLPAVTFCGLIRIDRDQLNKLFETEPGWKINENQKVQR